jgi:hypothetical protein
LQAVQESLSSFESLVSVNLVRISIVGEAGVYSG